MKSFFICCALLLGCLPAGADQEVYPSPYVAASGAWYAKCFPAPRDPDKPYGNVDREAGETLVYLLGDGPVERLPSGDAHREDKLMYRFNWYAPKIYLTPYDGGSIVRMGPWPRGREPSQEDLALAFYKDGVLLKRYSTLDLVGTYGSWIDLVRAKKVQVSTSHYSVIKKVVGFVSVYRKEEGSTFSATPAYGFEIILEDGSHRVFDLASGKVLVLSESEFTEPNPHM